MQKDLTFFYGLPLLLSSLIWLYNPSGGLGTLLFFVAVVLVDSGHVYTTIWRTYALKEERTQHSYYWWVPLGVFFGALTWALLEIPYLWSLVVYFTVYHHIRQFQGMTKWYMKLNRAYRKKAIHIFYWLLLTPFILFHFREKQNLYLYNPNDLFFFSYPNIFHYGLYAVAGLWALWLFMEFRIYQKEKVFEGNRLLSMGVPAAIQAKCFLFSSTVEGIVFPLLLIHGLTYIAIMAHSMEKLRSDLFQNFGKSLSLVVLLGAGLAIVETYGLGELIKTNDSYLSHSGFAYNFLIALFVTPTVSHYILDAYIWKKDHKGFQKILNN